jgi:LytS/YehU family sensor histidine kinase
VGWAPLRLVAFGLACTGTTFAVGGLVPALLAMRPTFLTDHASLAIATAMFMAAGWGLGRDIDHELGLARAEERVAALGREAEQARLLALRAHLDPHFLFNTLNAIAEWCRSDAEVAERAILQLSAMLRTVLEGVSLPSWPLPKELELAETLAALHRLRDPDRFRLVARVAEGLPAVEVPPLLLLPLIENAMKHGPGAGHRGEVSLDVSHDAASGEIAIRLGNPGAFTGRREGGEGLAMVEKRLALAYERGARMTIETDAEGPRTVVTVRLPTRAPRGAA